MSLGITGDRVPPGNQYISKFCLAWHGWLAHQYDDFPTRTNNKTFYEPHYRKEHKELESNTPSSLYLPADL
jgi:NADH:ubiquinone oxidoreductase subunit